MDRYEWKLNKAVMDRVYYTERIAQTTFGIATIGTLFDVFFINKNYFADASRRRIPKYWAFAVGTTAVSAFVLLKPLTSAEIKN